MPDQLFCYIRKRWLTATPEEMIRQFLIRHMVENLHYPQSHFIIEKSLHQFPHLNPANLHAMPSRRVDVILLAKDLHPNYPLYPLLLIECKAVPITAKTMRQVLGYNHYLRAYFVAVSNQTETQLAWINPQEQTLQITKNLPDYPTLFAQAKQIFH